MLFLISDSYRLILVLMQGPTPTHSDNISAGDWNLVKFLRFYNISQRKLYTPVIIFDENQIVLREGH